MLASFRRRSTPNGTPGVATDGMDALKDKERLISRTASEASSSNATVSASSGSGDRRKSWPWASIGQMSSRIRIARGRNTEMTLEEECSEANSKYSLGTFFFALPTELQLQILVALSTTDILQCRRVNKAFHGLIHSHEKSIAIQTAQRDLPSYALRLYPVIKNPNVRYMIQMQRRIHVATQVAGCIIDFIAVEFMRLRSKAELRNFRDDRHRALSTMVPLVFALYHFYEQWRWETMCRFDAKCRAVDSSSSAADTVTWSDTDAAECFRDLLASYSPTQLQKCIQIDKLLLRVFHRQLRPPSYATGPERALRGWRMKPPRFGDLHMTKMLGGLDIVKQVLVQRKYTAKVQLVENFIQSMSPTENVRWRRNWQVLFHGPFADQEPTVRPVVGIVDSRLKILPWWHGGWEAWTLHVEESGLYILQPREYMREILGYDVLHRPQPAGQDGMRGEAAVPNPPESEEASEGASDEEDPEWSHADDNDWWS